MSPDCSFHPKSRAEGKQKKTDSDRKAVISPTGVGDAEEEWGGEEGTREVREQREARRWEAEAVLLLLILFNSFVFCVWFWWLEYSGLPRSLPRRARARAKDKRNLDMKKEGCCKAKYNTK